MRDAAMDISEAIPAGRKKGLAEQMLGWVRAFFRDGLAGLRGVQGERRLELVERLELGGKRQLLLVVCDGKRYLVGAGGDSVQAIAEVRPEAEAGRHCEPEMRCGC